MSHPDHRNVLAPQPTDAQATEKSATVEAAPQQLENIEEIDFLLEEIESKIAPLALA